MTTPLSVDPTENEPDLWAIQGRCNAAATLVARRDGIDSLSEQTRSDINALLGYIVRLRLALDAVNIPAGLPHGLDFRDKLAYEFWRTNRDVPDHEGTRGRWAGLSEETSGYWRRRTETFLEEASRASSQPGDAADLCTVCNGSGDQGRCTRCNGKGVEPPRRLAHDPNKESK